MPSDTIQASMSGLAQAGGRLGPSEHLINALADDLAGFVALAAGGATVDGRAPGLGVDVRRDVHRAQLVDEVLRVVAFVGSERDAGPPVGARLDLVQGGDPLRMARGLGQTAIDDQPDAVLTGHRCACGHPRAEELHF
jgi:hypothetical protein